MGRRLELRHEAWPNFTWIHWGHTGIKVYVAFQGETLDDALNKVAYKVLTAVHAGEDVEHEEPGYASTSFEHTVNTVLE